MGAKEQVMTLTFQDLDPLMDEMGQWVMMNYPDEGCGLIVERESVLEVVGCENVQDQLHHLDPQRYARSARRAYHLDPNAWFAVEDRGARVRAVFHSHPDRGAYFSEDDRLGALGGAADGDPILPDVDYVVLSVRREGVADVKLFHWAPAEQGFREIV